MRNRMGAFTREHIAIQQNDRATLNDHTSTQQELRRLYEQKSFLAPPGSQELLGTLKSREDGWIAFALDTGRELSSRSLVIWSAYSLTANLDMMPVISSLRSFHDWFWHAASACIRSLAPSDCTATSAEAAGINGLACTPQASVGEGGQTTDSIINFNSSSKATA